MRWQRFNFCFANTKLHPRARTGKSKGPTGLPGEWDLLRPALLLLGNWGEENGWENSFHEGGVGNFANAKRIEMPLPKKDRYADLILLIRPPRLPGLGISSSGPSAHCPDAQFDSVYAPLQSFSS